MKKALTTMVAGSLLIGAAVPALAQTTSKPLGLSLRAGLFLPTDNGVKDLSDAWVSGGVDYALGHSLSVSLDYAGKAGFRTVPITLNWIVRSNQAYAFAGAGIGFLRDGGNDTTEFAFQGGVGYDLSTGSMPIFLEAKFMGSSNKDLDGFGVYIGVRF